MGDNTQKVGVDHILMTLGRTEDYIVEINENHVEAACSSIWKQARDGDHGWLPHASRSLPVLLGMMPPSHGGGRRFESRRIHINLGSEPVISHVCYSRVLSSSSLTFASMLTSISMNIVSLGSGLGDLSWCRMPSSTGHV